MYVSPVVCAVVGLIMGVFITIIGIVGVAVYIDRKNRKEK